MTSGQEEYMEEMVERFELRPRPIEQFLREEQVDDWARAELERVLQAVILLRNTGAALTAAMERADARIAEKVDASPDGHSVQPGAELDLSPSVKRLSVVSGFRFVVRDPNTGETYQVSDVEVEPIPGDARDEQYYRIAAY